MGKMATIFGKFVHCAQNGALISLLMTARVLSLLKFYRHVGNSMCFFTKLEVMLTAKGNS